MSRTPSGYTEGVSALLSSEQHARYARDGFVVIPGLFTPAEAARLTRWTEEVTAWPEVPGRHMVYWEAHRHEPGRQKNRIENFTYHEGSARCSSRASCGRRPPCAGG
jgi:hypothetical protein